MWMQQGKPNCLCRSVRIRARYCRRASSSFEKEFISNSCAKDAQSCCRVSLCGLAGGAQEPACIPHHSCWPTHTFTHIYTFTHIHTHSQIFTYIYTYSHTHTHTFTDIHTRSHTFTRIYTHMYIFAHSHTYTKSAFTRCNILQATLPPLALITV